MARPGVAPSCVQRLSSSRACGKSCAETTSCRLRTERASWTRAQDGGSKLASLGRQAVGSGRSAVELDQHIQQTRAMLEAAQRIQTESEIAGQQVAHERRLDAASLRQPDVPGLQCDQTTRGSRGPPLRWMEVLWSRARRGRRSSGQDSGGAAPLRRACPGGCSRARDSLRGRACWGTTSTGSRRPRRAAAATSQAAPTGSWPAPLD